MNDFLNLENYESKANPEDVKTIDGIMRAFYEVISGPAGAPRQWDRDKSLYAPNAILVPAGIDPESRPFALVLNLQDYIRRSEPLLAPGFFEYEIHRVTHVMGKIAHVFSTYEARRTPDGPVFKRGVNSVELVYANDRWWIVAGLWDAERDGNPIPPEFLP